MYSSAHFLHDNAATGYYCSRTPIKMWLARGISVINEIKSGLLVVAACSQLAPVVFHFSLLPSFVFISPATQLFICSAVDILSLTLAALYTALPLCH